MNLKQTVSVTIIWLGLSASSVVASSDWDLWERLCVFERTDGNIINTTTLETSELIIRCLWREPIDWTVDMICQEVRWSPWELFEKDIYTECRPQSTLPMS